MPKFAWKSLTDNVLEGYVRQDMRNDRAVVFVHGFGGDLKTTWVGAKSELLFHDYVKDDPELADHDVLSFGYKSGFWGGASVKNHAVALKNAIETHINGHSVVLVTHSLGGLVCMRYILDLLEKEKPLPVTGLIMYGTPTTGTELVQIAQLLALALKFKVPGVGWIPDWLLKKNKQLQQLAAHSEFVQELHDNWILRVANGGDASLRSTLRGFLNVRMVTGNEDWVVKEHSAKGIYGQIDWHPVSFGHIALVKPESNTDPRFGPTKSFLKICRQAKTPAHLARIRHFSDEIWKTRQKRMIKNWQYTVDLRLRDRYEIPELADAGFAQCHFSCKYNLILEQPFVEVGLSYGIGGKEGVWKNAPGLVYAHQMLVDLVPERCREGLDAAIQQTFATSTRVQQWDKVFPSMRVSLDNVALVPGEIRPGDGGPSPGWLRRQFDLPTDPGSLVGKEVTLELTYRSLAPTALTCFSVFFPWLTEGCQCLVRVQGDLDCFVCFPHFATGQSIDPQYEPGSKVGRGVTVSTDDVILPGCAFDLHWTNKVS